MAKKKITAAPGTIVTKPSTATKTVTAAPIVAPTVTTPVAPAPAPLNGGMDLNNLAYLKGTAESAKASGNMKLYNWAAAQAQKAYGSASNPDLVKQFQGMDAAALNAYRKVGQPAPAAAPVTSETPVEEAPAESVVADTPWTDFQSGGGQVAQDYQTYTNPTGDTTSSLMDQFTELMNGQGDQIAQWQKDWAAQQAAKQAAEEKGNIETLLGDLRSGQQFELDTIQNNLNEGKASLEDKTFQNWLATRQDVANRGLAGSGIANDANTRLMLSQGRELAGLTGQANTNLGETTRRYGSKLSEAFQRLSQVNPELAKSDMMMKLFQDNSKTMTDRAKILSDMVGQFLPYDRVKPIDVMQLSSQERQFYDKLSSDEKMGYEKMASDERQTYASLGSQERQTYAKLTSDERQTYATLTSQERQTFGKLETEDRQFYSQLEQEDRQFYDKLAKDERIELASIMGIDPITGRPTIDMAKLDETIRANDMANTFEYDKLTAQTRQWGEENELSAEEINLGRDEFNARAQNDADMIEASKSATTSEQSKLMLDALKARLSSVDDQIKAKISTGKTALKDDDALLAERNSVMESINSLIGLGE